MRALAGIGAVVASWATSAPAAYAEGIPVTVTSTTPNRPMPRTGVDAWEGLGALLVLMAIGLTAALRRRERST